MATMNEIRLAVYGTQTVARMHSIGLTHAPEWLLWRASEAERADNLRRCWYLRGVYDWVVDSVGQATPAPGYAAFYDAGRDDAEDGAVRWVPSEGSPVIPVDPDPQPFVPEPLARRHVVVEIGDTDDHPHTGVTFERTGWYVLCGRTVVSGPWASEQDAEEAASYFEGSPNLPAVEFDDPAVQGAMAREEEESECELHNCAGWFANGGDWKDVHRCDACARFPGDAHAMAHAYRLFAGQDAYTDEEREAVRVSDGLERWRTVPADTAAASEPMPPEWLADRMRAVISDWYDHDVNTDETIRTLFRMAADALAHEPVVPGNPWTTLTIGFLPGSDGDTVPWALGSLVESNVTVEVHTVAGGTVCGNLTAIEYDNEHEDETLVLEQIDDDARRVRTVRVLFKHVVIMGVL